MVFVIHWHESAMDFWTSLFPWAEADSTFWKYFSHITFLALFALNSVFLHDLPNQISQEAEERGLQFRRPLTVPPANAGDLGSLIPWRRARLPTPVFLPGESHGQRSLVGYSPQGHKDGWDFVTKQQQSWSAAEGQTGCESAFQWWWWVLGACGCRCRKGNH